VHPRLAGLEKLYDLNEELAKQGFSDEIRHKFFWENATRFFA